MKYTYRLLTAVLCLGGAALAQPPAPAAAPAPFPQSPDAVPMRPSTPPPADRDRIRLEKMDLLRGPGNPPLREEAPMPALRGPRGRWWGNPELVQKLGITPDQVKKMDDILQQHRLHLIDLHATLDKQELILEPLVSADQPDETRILAQIDKVAQARADLEKANARMLLDIRRVLTQEQWQKLKSETPSPAPAPTPRPRLKRQ